VGLGGEEQLGPSLLSGGGTRGHCSAGSGAGVHSRDDGMARAQKRLRGRRYWRSISLPLDANQQHPSHYNASALK
jgi:hypothetical protein